MQSEELNISDAQAYAAQLYRELGSRSIAVAARRAVEATEAGKDSDAKTWRKIEEALLNMRGPRQS